MNSVIKEWIAKAEADYRTAQRESTVQDGANYDAVCFHAQQCIEKLMKAFLIKSNINPPKIHDLTALTQLLPANNQSLFNIQQLRFLSNAAISFRYPGESADQADAEESLQICGELRRVLHELLKYKR
ncbi:MAG TPA: DNA-binding protein [Firmicutes bacterium]|jgi:HEPN domain-containing protein|nr:DNA-binding protein [Bacillota bacterium]